jgi:hypothetical protein
MTAYKGSVDTAPLIHKLRTRWRSAVGLHALAALALQRRSCVFWRKFCFPYRNSNPGSFIPYPRRYTDCAIPGFIINCGKAGQLHAKHLLYLTLQSETSENTASHSETPDPQWRIYVKHVGKTTNILTGILWWLVGLRKGATTY